MAFLNSQVLRSSRGSAALLPTSTTSTSLSPAELSRSVEQVLATLRASPRLVGDGLGHEIAANFTNPVDAAKHLRALPSAEVERAVLLAATQVPAMAWKPSNVCRCTTNQLAALVIAYVLRYLAELSRSGSPELAKSKAMEALGGLLLAICPKWLGPPKPGGKTLLICGQPSPPSPPTGSCDWWNQTGNCKWNAPSGQAPIVYTTADGCKCFYKGSFQHDGGCLPDPQKTKAPSC